MRTTIFFKLSEKLGPKKVNLLIKNISTLKAFNENVIQHIAVGDNKDIELFKRFKKLLMCNILCLSNFSENNVEFEVFYKLFKTNIQQTNKNMKYCKFRMYCK